MRSGSRYLILLGDQSIIAEHIIALQSTKNILLLAKANGMYLGLEKSISTKGRKEMKTFCTVVFYSYLAKCDFVVCW